VTKSSNDNRKPPEQFALTAAVEIDLAAEAAGAGQDKPALPRFSMVAYTGGPMKVAGWRNPVVVDLAGLAIPSQSRPIRFGHDANSGVGHSDSIRVQDGRLVAAGVVSRDTAAAREIIVSAKNGFPWQASIGASVEQFEFVKESQTVLVNGREFSGPINVVRQATLGEISFVDLGADGNTSASVAAARQEKDTMTDTDTTVQTTTQDTTAGTGKDTPAPAVQAAAPDAGITADPVADMRARAGAELERIAAVRKVCANGGDNHADICANAIKGGWDVTRTELEVMRADRPKAPSTHVPDNSVTGLVLEAACMLTAGFSGLEKLHDERTLDLASRRFRGGIGLQELLLEAA
jgi:hypothetical protein